MRVSVWAGCIVRTDKRLSVIEGGGLSRDILEH